MGVASLIFSCSRSHSISLCAPSNHAFETSNWLSGPSGGRSQGPAEPAALSREGRYRSPDLLASYFAAVEGSIAS